MKLARDGPVGFSSWFRGPLRHGKSRCPPRVRRTLLRIGFLAVQEREASDRTTGSDRASQMLAKIGISDEGLPVSLKTAWLSRVGVSERRGVFRHPFQCFAPVIRRWCEWLYQPMHPKSSWIPQQVPKAAGKLQVMQRDRRFA